MVRADAHAACRPAPSATISVGRGSGLFQGFKGGRAADAGDGGAVRRLIVESNQRQPPLPYGISKSKVKSLIPAVNQFSKRFPAL
eukprot:6972332-Pyramimonas_sp.AAC.2